MPNRKYNYADIRKYHRTTAAQKERYYSKSECGRNAWTDTEKEMVLAHVISDTELSEIIHHSVMSIQVCRTRLKKEKGEKNEN